MAVLKKIRIFTYVANSKVMDPNIILMLLADLVRQDRSLPSHIDFLDLKTLTGGSVESFRSRYEENMTFLPLWWSQINVRALSSLNQNLWINIDLGPT